MNIEPVSDMLFQTAKMAGELIVKTEKTLTPESWMIGERGGEGDASQAYFFTQDVRSRRLGKEMSELLQKEDGPLKALEDFLPDRKSSLWIQLNGSSIVRCAWDEPETFEVSVERNTYICPLIDRNDFYTIRNLKDGDQLYPTTDGFDYMELIESVGEGAANIAKKFPLGRVKIVEVNKTMLMIHELKKQKNLIGLFRV